MRKPSMRIASFLAGLSGLLAGLVGLEAMTPFVDPFTPSNAPTVVDLDYLSPFALNRLKSNHVAGQPRFDVGIFSDSRSEPVGNTLTKGLGLSFFSFSISGEGFRSSVSRLERLADSGKAPRLALVQLANFESQEFNLGASLTLSQRLRDAWRDLAVAARHPDLTRATWVAMAKQYAMREGHLIRHLFDASRLKIIISRLLVAPPKIKESVDGPEFGMRPDGSRRALHRTLPEPPLLPRQSEHVIPFYLRTDLERLRDLGARGIKVIVYEIPLARNSRNFYAAQPSAHAQAHRALFLRVCAELELACLPQPADVALDDANWPDPEHMPERPLTAYLRGILEAHPQLIAAGRGQP